MESQRNGRMKNSGMENEKKAEERRGEGKEFIVE
jgi:hypothetical protein